ncbi:hypothetical protein AARAC_008808 [Aspergillus arachidicola]|uniref:Letm1 RBD domain-containing protein n=1 Tax=Aspergillus arachidicola TaxID=656916 RepID=A0A2G7FZJ3_9EURO|nr:hypothetical protein AARAC_008808 [Aspergillus arachidicola]
MSSSLGAHKALVARSYPLFSTPFSALPQHQSRRRDIYLTSRGHASSSKTHIRPSSSAQPATSRVPSTSSTATTSPANDVNPPPSTRPADLNLPDPVSRSAATADKLKRYIAMGRAYLSFYKPASKTFTITIAPHCLSVARSSNKGTAFRKAIESVKLSRSSFQLVRRAAYDVRRMIPFTLILIVCGEMTPLAVLALGNAVTPFTCRVPRQLEKDRAQRVARKRAALVAQQAATSGSVTPPAAGSDLELDILVKMYTNLEWIESASAEEILRACAVLNLVKTHTRPSVLLSLYRARLQRYAEYLSLDDQLIRRCGGVRAMEGAEVRTAVEERGGVGVTEGKEGWDAERDERRWLEKWLERR